MATLKQQLMAIMNQLPTRKHAEVFIDAMVNAKHELNAEGIFNPTLEDVMTYVIAEIEEWKDAINTDYADPIGSHKKGAHDDEIFETATIFQSLGYQ